MTCKEAAKRDLQDAIERMKREPTVQHWLAMDRLAEVYVRECEAEVSQKVRMRNG